MVLDSSALLAILFNEAEATSFAHAIEQASPRLISAASLLEAAIAIEARKGPAGGRELDLLIYRAGIEVIPVDHEQAELGRQAWRDFGKGNHEAALNYGDCFAYALAKLKGLPLLFKGTAFSRTDILPAEASPIYPGSTPTS